MGSITVGEAQEALPHGTVLIGGASGLGRALTGTATLRTRTPAFPALRGGELALVPLNLLRQTDPGARLDRLVRQLADAGVGGIVVLDVTAKPETALAMETAARAANDHNIPVFSCGEGPTAEAVDADLHRFLSMRRERLLQRGQELQREFTTLAFNGEGLPAIVEHLATVTGLPAAWEDRALELRAWALPAVAEGSVAVGVGASAAAKGALTNGPATSGRVSHGSATNGALTTGAHLSSAALVRTELGDVPAALRGARLPLLRWSRALSPSAHPEVTVLPLRADEQGPLALWRRLVVPVAVGEEISGYLSLIGHNGDAGHEARLALAGAGLAASIEALRLRTANEAQGTATASLLRDWLLGRFDDAGAITARLVELGHTPPAPYGVLVFESAGPGRRVPPLAQVAQAFLPESAGESHPPFSAALDEQRIALLVPGVDVARLANATETVEAILQETFGDNATAGSAAGAPAAAGTVAVVAGTRVSVGIGRAAVDVGDVPRAYREAVRALEVARRRDSTKSMGSAYFGALGAYRLLAAVTPEEELRGFVDDVLGPLEAYDQRTGGELVRTLDAYVTSGGSVMETAERLHTHRNTVIYRMDRIAEVLGADARHPSQRLALHLALRAADLLAR